MGVLLAFLVGWAVGARGGAGQYDDVVAAYRALRDSDEVAALLAALRSHAGYTLKEVGEWLSSDERISVSAPDVVMRVRDLVMRPGETSPEA